MNIIKILAILSLLIIITRWSIALFNLITKHPKKGNLNKKEGEISVLVPARNEAHNLPILLNGLIKCDNTIGEILIYDDQSEDETASEVKIWARYDKRIRLIEGNVLPSGWLGKNHACHQLADQAKGKYLLYLDADVKVNQEAIDLALSRMKKDQLSLFSFFPIQEMRTPGEWMLVAQVNIILVSLLPMAIASFIPISMMVAANGQFMMFDSEIYRKYLFHKELRQTAVEDVAIAQHIKKKRLKLHTALAPEGLHCRMYSSYREALSGLSRSARFFFGGSMAMGWVYVFFSVLGWWPVMLSYPDWGLPFYLSLLVTMRIFVSLASHQPIIKNLIYLPLQQIGLVHLFIQATLQHINRKTTWKGRTI
ncbi:glycosyltransferase [Marinilabilia rubra]|uniref:Glycosyl transferase n=1 Tax=Marinilabilia rubra TaxID=2162893 RepID=A0A2U2B559_9BACT|nr:glycosyltransferase family 2 protein [Marinilabilia rubra]PWD98196.1 glycosyl transferase [Marinilabilia rubra]